MFALRRAVAAALAVMLACAAVAEGGPKPRPPSGAARAPRVRRIPGYDGDPTLVVDPGRRLEAVQRAAASSATPTRIELARVKAREVFAAKRRTARGRIHGLMALAREFLPVGELAAELSQELSAEDAARSGETRLSRHVEEGYGRCRERARLLAVMLGENGVPARVVGGLLYRIGDDGAVTAVGDEGHAWVEARLPGRDEFVLIDPTLRKAPVRREMRNFREDLPDGRSRRVQARVSGRLVYVPGERGGPAPAIAR